jgi:uncharacterized membrane protein YeaQ/YmgE (transglycosylase-associated protein family)
MHHLTATDYTWFVMIGLTVGYIGDLLFHNEKVSWWTNLLLGIAGAFVGGLIPVISGTGGNLMMAGWVSFILLLLINVQYIGEMAKLHTHEPKDEKPHLD